MIYSKDENGVNMDDKEFKEYISKAVAKSNTDHKAFYEAGKNSTRVVFLKKWDWVQEPCKNYYQNKSCYQISIYSKNKIYT